MGGAARSVDYLCLVSKPEGTSGLRSYTAYAMFAIHTMGHLPLQQCLVYESLINRPSYDIEAHEFRLEYFVSNGFKGMMANSSIDETSAAPCTNFALRELCGYVWLRQIKLSFRHTL